MPATIGPVIFDLNGLEITQEEIDILNHPLIGGVILFARNYASPQQLNELTQAIRANKSSPILICVDQEGGRVQRFKEGFTRIPSMQAIGELFTHTQSAGLALAKACGYVMAAELLQHGVDLSFAPVVDLRKMNNPAINDRSFDREPLNVIPLANALMEGMEDAGMANCIKHFPGHGSVIVDSHVAMPEDLRELDQILNDDMLPFQRLSARSIMASHILFPAIDSKPVGFSKVWLQDILREQLNFSGLIFSDDLSMQGAMHFGDCATRSALALQAGCDMILICNNRADVHRTLTDLNDVQPVSALRFRAVQGNFNKSKDALNENQHIINTFINEFNTLI